MSNLTALVQKLWNYCNILRDDGLSYGDYVEQLTFLLFLKMADEQSKPPFNKTSPIPKGFGWDALLKLKDDALEESANLPSPEIIAADITADLEAALEQFATIAEDLK